MLEPCERKQCCFAHLIDQTTKEKLTWLLTGMDDRDRHHEKTPLKIGKYRFNNKQNSYKFTRTIMNQLLNHGSQFYYPKSPSPEIYDFLCGLASKKPYRFEITKYIGNPLLRLWKNESDLPVSLSWAKRSKFDFRKVAEKSKLASAMRILIQDQIDDFRSQTHKISCEMCDSFEKPQVDHIYPFDSLKSEFIKNNPFFGELHKNEYGRVIIPGRHYWKENWSNYHLKHARYQILCRSCNLTKSNLFPATSLRAATPLKV